MRSRDNQRSRVYAWEAAAVQKLSGVSLYKSEYDTLEECEAFMRPIWRSERGRVGLAKQEAPELSRKLWGQRRGFAGDNHVIKLPRWARSRWVILHEMVHRLTPMDEAHGPRFVSVLIGLVSRHCGYDAHQLMALADEMGCRYYVRSIGVVPTFSTGNPEVVVAQEHTAPEQIVIDAPVLPIAVRPASQVHHTITKYGPLTAMDIACHSSLLEGIDLTQKQVRGGALSLIRQGKARWLRKRLHLMAVA